MVKIPSMKPSSPFNENENYIIPMQGTYKEFGPWLVQLELRDHNLVDASPLSFEVVGLGLSLRHLASAAWPRVDVN